MDNQPIIFFDGACGLCHKSVQFILTYDRKNQFYFSPLGSAFSKQKLAKLDTSFDTLYLTYNGITYIKSDAWLKTLHLLGGPWRILSTICYLIPKPIRTKSYDFIAKHRLKIFGQRNNCDLLSKNQKDRFL